MQIDNKVLKLQQKIVGYIYPENINKWPTYTIDPWTTWFWTARVQFYVDFFQYMGTARSEVVESEGA